jgi:hypothetical protein
MPDLNHSSNTMLLCYRNRSHLHLPLVLLDQEGGDHHHVVCVHISEAPPIAALDQIARKEKLRLLRPCSIWMFPLCGLQVYLDLNLSRSLFCTSYIWYWFCLVRLCRNFFVFYVAKPINGIRARSTHSWFSRVKHIIVVTGVDVFVANLLFIYFLMSLYSGVKVAHANFTRPFSWDWFCVWYVACST